MAYLEAFARSGDSFEDRVGVPEAFDAAIGHVAMAFSYIEDTLSESIGELLRIDSRSTAAVTAEMSFRNKVHLFASLVRLQLEHVQFNVGTLDPQAYLGELIGACFKCEEMRNSVMHSSWSVEGMTSGTKRRRKKITAKATRGVHTHEEELTAGDVLDIYDYTIYVATMIDEFMPRHAAALESPSAAT